MKSLVQLDAKRVIELSTKAVQLIEEYRTQRDISNLARWEEEYLKSLTYKIHKLFGKNKTTEGYHIRIADHAYTHDYFFDVYSSAYYDQLELAKKFLKITKEAVNHNIAKYDSVILVSMDELNYILNVITKLEQQE